MFSHLEFDVMRLTKFAVTLMLGVLAFCHAGLSQQNKPKIVSVLQLEHYIESLDTVYAEFVQSNSDGTKSNGRLYIDRPRKARFEYLSPDTGIMIAQGGSVAVFDTKSNTEPLVFPLRATPLFPILTQRVSLTNPNYFVKHLVGATHSELHLRAKSDQFKGHIEIRFNNEPIQLTGWVSVDEFGNRTSVRLIDPRLGVKLDQRLFNIALQKERLGLD